jgi:hypothetical protein
MSEERFEQLELDFTEGENEMSKEVGAVESKEENVVAPEAPQEQEGPKVVAAMTIVVLDNGALDIQVPEGMPELKAIEAEQIARQVSEQLRDMRIAQSALELFKTRLG